jgi:hypothetical protein
MVSYSRDITLQMVSYSRDITLQIVWFWKKLATDYSG